jgi:hypothetical protein
MKNALSIDVRGSMRPILVDLDRVAQTCVPAATVSALNKTAKHVQVLARREIAATFKVPQKTISKKLSIGKAKKSRMNAVLYLKHRPINPWLVSAARARKEAAAQKGWALKPGWVTFKRRYHGKTHGPSSFPAGIVLKRRGRERWPLDAVGIPMEGAGAIVQKHVRGSEAFFSKTFAHELQYRIDKKRTALAAAESEAA